MEKECLEKGDLKLVEGKTHEPISSLAVRCVGSKNISAVILDGSSTVNPYFMVRKCKKRGFKIENVLNQVYIARAFTAYQFKDLVQKTKNKIRAENEVGFLGVVSISPLFEDDELEEEEGRWIRSKLIREIKKIVKKENIYSALVDPEAETFE